MASGYGGTEAGAATPTARNENAGLTNTAKSSGNQVSTTFVWMIAVLLLLAVVPYLNTLPNGFVYDDNNEVLTNPYIRSFAHLGEIFSTRILAHLGARGATNYYRPISIIGFLICYKLFGLLPYGFHLANLVLNTIVVCLLFGLTKRLFRDQWLAFLAAAIFALHPIHTESVAWISGVTDLELAVFYLAAFWFFVASARPQSERSEWMQAGMVVSFAVALLSKEQAMTLPLVATIFEHRYRDDRTITTWRQKVARYRSLWLLVPVYVLFRLRVLGAFAPVQLTRNVSWYEAVLSATPMAAEYVFKMLWPVHLMAYYPFHKSLTLFDVNFVAGLAALLMLGGAFRWLWRRQILASFGLIWFLINIAPVLNARWLGPNVFTERYLYLPSVGLCWLAAWGILQLWAQNTTQAHLRRIISATALGILAALALARIVVRNRDWRDDETYYRVGLASAPDAVTLRLNLGAVYWNHMRPDAAEREWKKALALSPNNAQLLNNLGLVYEEKKDNDAALACFERAMRLRPNLADAHLNLGRLYEAEGNSRQAELQLRAAVALAPLNVEARNELGSFHFKAGRLEQAETEFQASVASIPNSTAFASLGDIARRQRQSEPAAYDYRQAISLNEFDPRAHFGLAAILETRGLTKEAEAQYRAGLRVDPHNQEAQAALQRLASTPTYVHISKP